VFLFVDLFDNLGTLMAVTRRAGLIEPAGNIPGLNRMLVADSVATMVGTVAGTSTVILCQAPAGLRSADARA
jgi:AGZA family xanthine/uracil permease-like MFS transporter